MVKIRDAAGNPGGVRHYGQACYGKWAKSAILELGDLCGAHPIRSPKPRWKRTSHLPFSRAARRWCARLCYVYRSHSMLNLAMLLELSARRDPGKVAVILDDMKLRYAEVNGAANKIANGLVAMGVR